VLLLGPNRLAILPRVVRSAAHRFYRLALNLDAWWVRGAVRRVAGPGSVAVPTYTNKWELAALYKLAVTAPTGAVAVEIGSHLGASACYLAAGLRAVGGTLCCIDTWNNDAMGDEPQSDTFAQFAANTAPVADIIKTVRKNSTDLTDLDLPASIDLGFIDGDHSYTGAVTDFRALAPRIKPGGVLAFHDSICVDGVCRVIGEGLATGDWLLAGQVLSLTWLKKSARQGAA
jgi:cephalosporin hydroxylase